VLRARVKALRLLFWARGVVDHDIDSKACCCPDLKVLFLNASTPRFVELNPQLEKLECEGMRAFPVYVNRPPIKLSLEYARLRHGDLEALDLARQWNFAPQTLRQSRPRFPVWPCWSWSLAT